MPEVFFACGVMWQLAWINQRPETESEFFGILGADFFLGIIGLVTFESIWPRLWKWLVLLLMSAVIAASAWGCDRLSQRWHNGFEAHYRRRINVDKASFLPDNQAKPVTICVLDSRYYPYFGSRRQIRVCQPIFVFSSDWLVDYMYREKVDFIVHRVHPFGGLKRRSTGIKDCIAEHPEMFHLVYESKSLNVHQFYR